MLFTRSNVGAGHSPSVAQDQRLRHPCRRFGKLNAAFELRHSKELASSCIMMQSMSVLPAVCFDILDFPSRLLGSVTPAPGKYFFKFKICTHWIESGLIKIYLNCIITINLLYYQKHL